MKKEEIFKLPNGEKFLVDSESVPPIKQILTIKQMLIKMDKEENLEEEDEKE